MPLFAFHRASIARSGVPAVRDLTWAVEPGEAWAVVGPGGCGKSTLLETLAGRHRVVAGTFEPPPAARLVPFRETSRLFSPERFYYQQRFDFADAAECPTVREYLLSGQPGVEAELPAVADRLRVGDLLGVAMLKLSNGQTRRVRLARGLLARPPLLLLDDPFGGLDATGRREFAELLGEVARGGQQVVLAARADDVPAGVRLLELPPPNTEATVFAASAAAVGARGARGEGGKRDVIALRRVSVRHGGKTILDDITWTVRAGERWAVLGPNGAGKTTLLSLVCGDHPQAFCTDVSVFGRRRGEETLWELKRKIGLVSPELHACFPPGHTALSAALTGFRGHLTAGPHTPEQAESVRRLFAAFGLSEFAARPWPTLSAGTQRAVLVVRALAPAPPLVVLDEPFQGVDAGRVRVVRSWLDAGLGESQTLLMVTHRPEELPACVSHTLLLADGRVAAGVG